MQCALHRFGDDKTLPIPSPDSIIELGDFVLCFCLVLFCLQNSLYFLFVFCFDNKHNFKTSDWLLFGVYMEEIGLLTWYQS